LKDFKDEFEDIRNARRKIQNNITCRFDDNPLKFPVFELSSQGFSFLCQRDSCFFKRGAILDRISVLNEEELEIIKASGTIVHTVDFGYDKVRIGVFFSKKTMDRALNGKIRIPRHLPNIQLNALLTFINRKKVIKITGTIIDYTASTARIRINEIHSHKFEMGEELEILIEVKDTVLFDGSAYVLRIKDDKSEIIVHFSNQMFDISRVELTSKAFHNQERIHSAIVSLNDYKNINNDFKALVCDWRLYLNHLKKTLDQEERIHLFSSETEKEQFLQGIEDKILTQMTNFISSLNFLAEKVPDTEHLIYKKYFRENLLSLLRTSPLASSIYDKDKGYPGDYETIKQFFQNPYSGDSLFDKMMNKFLCASDAVSAHQERINFLYEQLCLNYKKSKEEFTFLAFGSGPAEEVIRFVKNNSFEKPVHATLLDMDAFALADFSERLQYIPGENFKIELINFNILNILRHQESNPIKKKYSFIYCAGLFDYFRKTICKRMVQFLINHAEPGGSIIITNVHKNSTTRYFMDYAGGWEIIHRNDLEMKELIPPGYSFKKYSDQKKANIFLKINLPKTV
jgi:extracellular factor (EF) 3-hydroxypalmitic acid methyl ester biosynthesis protein